MLILVIEALPPFICSRSMIITLARQITSIILVLGIVYLVVFK